MLQVAHKASTRARQQCRSAETLSRRPHVQPFSFISLSTVLLQVSLRRPLFLWPSGVHHRAILVKAVVCWRSTCPIHRQRLRLTWVEMGSISALRCSSSLVMTSTVLPYYVFYKCSIRSFGSLSVLLQIQHHTNRVAIKGGMKILSVDIISEPICCSTI